MLARWENDLKQEGAGIDVWYLSVDEDEAALKQLLSAKPEIAAGESVRLSNFSDLGPWLKKYRLDDTASIPIQVLASPGGKVRCVKMGSVHESDLRTVKALLQGT